ncbi:MAG TPA: aconitase family protein, partial [Gemmatimonadaceae bacterium]|nr:aconitase family protein [Gemmatimonadaceae bacterium]
MSDDDIRREIVVFDTTLRDGEQTPGCALGPDDKVAIAEQLVRLGVDVIEAGFPAASAGEARAVRAVAEAVARMTDGPAGPAVCALARATPRDIEIVAEAIAPAPRRRIHTFIATSDLHLERKLQLTRAQALDRAVAAVRLARDLADDVEFSAEDASRSDWEFLADVLRAAAEAGARTLNVPDTVGWAAPAEYAELIERVCGLAATMPGVVISTHCHDDLGLAVANTLAGVRAGAGQVEVTINGLGERAGNAALEEVVMALATRSACFGGATRVDTRELGRASRVVSERTGIVVPATKAVVGANAFAHESGIHQAGVLADPRTYEIIAPESVGATGALVLGKHSGKHALAERLRCLDIALDDGMLDAANAEVKRRAEAGEVVDDEVLAEIGRGAWGVGRREPSPTAHALHPTPHAPPRTLLDKIWDAHVVRDATPDAPAVLYVDLHLVHEVTSAQAFAELRARGLRVRCPERTLATMDHATPTESAGAWWAPREKGRRMLALAGDDARAQLEALAHNAAEAEVPLLALGDPRRGIVHVVGPELGLTQPGMTIVCGDSHTSTHGAFGALAFGIGT